MGYTISKPMTGIFVY